MNASVVKNEAEKEVEDVYCENEDRNRRQSDSRYDRGQMKEKQTCIGKMINPAHLKGYLFETECGWVAH